MVKDDKRGHRSWWWVLPAAAGLALVAAAVLVATAGRTPTVSAQADCTLDITKTADVSIAPIGGDITYTIVVTNASDPASVCLLGVTVTDTIPANTDCIDATASGSGSFTDVGCAADGDVVWTSGADLADAATATLTLKLRVTGGDGTTITNTAEVEGVQEATGDIASDTVVVNDCDLTISKDSDDNEVGEGGEIVYTIDIENTGTADCEDVVITEDIPADTDCTATDVIEANSDVDIDDADGCDASGNVTWEVTEGTLDGLEPGDEAEVEMTVKLTSGAEDGDEINNEACVTSDDTDAATEICDTLTVDVEGVAATKTPTPGPTATVGPTATARPVVPPVAPPPVVAPPAPTGLIAPLTGSGTGSGSGGSLPLALGLAGGCLLLLGGVAMLRRPR